MSKNPRSLRRRTLNASPVSDPIPQGHYPDSYPNLARCTSTPMDKMDLGPTLVALEDSGFGKMTRARRNSAKESGRFSPLDFCTKAEQELAQESGMGKLIHHRKQTPRTPAVLPELLTDSSSSLHRCTSTPLDYRQLDFESLLSTPEQIPRRSPRTRSSLATNETFDFSCSSNHDEEGSKKQTLSTGKCSIAATFSQDSGFDSASKCNGNATNLSSAFESITKDLPLKRVLRNRDIVPWPQEVKESDEKRLVYRPHAPPGSFLGNEHVDIMKHFMDMGLVHVISKVFECLSEGSDLCSVSMVSNVWKSCLQLDSKSDARRKKFLEEQKLNWENLSCHRKLRRSPRKAMTDCSNIEPFLSPNSKRKGDKSASGVIISPSKIRHRLFTEEASKLLPGEKLQCCPRCSSPARVLPLESRATCTRISCGFDFCQRCMCESHSGDPASQAICLKNSGKTPGKGTRGTVASRKSKRRLRRL